MSISPALKTSARAAYRDLLRAAAKTFEGDDRIRQAFRLKMRTETLVLDAQQTSAKDLEDKITLAHELATILRRNVVQAHKVEGKDAWSVRITKDTEIGDNDTIKGPKAESSRSARKQEKEQQSSIESAALPKSVPRNYSSLKKAHKERKIPELREQDIEESFVRGSGPGGQSINKTENNVQLLHKPTGMRVSCQETRSLQTNRMLARRLLLEKLDKIVNPGLSKGDVQRAKQQERERRRRKKAKKKVLMRRLNSDQRGDEEE